MTGSDFRAEREAELAIDHRRTHRHASHHLDTGRDDHVVRTGDHALRGEVGGLLAGPTLTIDGRAGHRFGPPCREHRIAGHVDGLLADLHHTAHHDVIHDRRVDTGAIDQRLQRLSGKVDRVPVLELAVAATEWRTYGIDDDCSGHDRIPSIGWTACSLQRAGAETQTGQTWNPSSRDVR